MVFFYIIDWFLKAIPSVGISNDGLTVLDNEKKQAEWEKPKNQASKHVSMSSA